MYFPSVLTETPEAITITHQHPKWLRFMLAGLGLLPLFGFYEMLLKPRWNLAAFTLDNPSAFAFAAIPAIIGVGCMSIVVVMLSGAIFGPDITCVFDKKRRLLIYSESKRPFRPAQYFEYSFASLTDRLSVREDASGEGANTWNVMLKLPHHKNAHTLYYYTAREPAEALRERLTAPT